MSQGISIIFGFKNRERARVKNCLDSLKNQTFTDFEVVFIDYGSDKEIADGIKTLVSSYPFASYHYNHTVGMPWNRSHALNSGVRLAKNNYILFGDVDLIYAPGVLRALAENATQNTQLYSMVYFLPEGLTSLNKILEGNWQSIPSSDENGKGGVHLIAKKHLEKIRGYDEYYCFWGVEDRDLYSRLDQLGIESKWIDRKKHPVFHQWHPDASGANKGFFPDRWWESMNIHFSVLKDTLKRNDEHWGKLYTDADRKVFRAKEVDLIYKERGNWFYKGIVVTEIMDSLKRLGEDECLKITIDKNKDLSKRKVQIANRFIKAFLPNFKLATTRTPPFNPPVDLIYIIWTLIKDEKTISDYVFIENSGEHIIKLMAQ